jgi:putative membrane protein
MSFLIRILINAAALLGLSYIHFMNIHVNNITAALVGALVLGLANAIVRPILITVSCPLEVLSLGLFTLVINALIFYVVLHLVPGFVVPSFWAAFWGALAMSVISWLISLVVRDVRPSRR